MAELVTNNYSKFISKNIVQNFLIRKFFETLVSTIKDKEINKILDVGCGEGITLARLKEQNIGKSLEGIDILEDAIIIGKKLYPYLDLKHGSIYNLPYKNQGFDLIMCTEVLEHLKYPERALNEIIQIKSKLYLFSVPNEPYFRMANFLAGKYISRFGNDIEHIQHWSSSGFRSFINQKLEIVSVKNPFPWTIILARRK